MPADHADDTVEQLLRRACTELEQSLRAGKRGRAEQVFARYPALAARPDFALEVIYATEYTTRALLEEEPRPDEFYERFPQFRAALERQFHMEELLSDADDEAAAPRVLVLPTHDGADWGMEHYEIVRQFGQGFPTVVYEARQLSRGRRVALKMLLGGGASTDEDRQRFRRGAEDQARLDHPNVVRVFDVGEHEGVSFFAMELGDGGTLAEKIAGRPQPPTETARIMRALAEAVQHAHGRGIVHRDLKPANVVLTADGTPKITDFGLAKRLESTSGQSVSGDLLGTPPYMAPEQAAGRVRAIGPRTDVYGLGAVLYELLTGRKPFEGSNVPETLIQVLQRDVVKPRLLHPFVDRRLESVCLKCLAKRRTDRYPTAQALAEDVGRWQAGERPRAHGLAERGQRFVRRYVGAVRAAVAAAAVAAAALLVAAVIKYQRDPLRELERMQAALRRNEFVPLFHTNGEPRWSRPIWGECSSRRLPDGSFSMESQKLDLLELLPDPGHAYFRFGIEICHTDADVQTPEGRVGVFLGLSTHYTPDTKHLMYSVVFNGLDDQAKRKRPLGLGSPPQAKWRLDPPGNPVNLDAMCLYAVGSREDSHKGSHSLFHFPRGPRRALVWRKVVIERLPDKIAVHFWKDADVSEEPQSASVSAKTLRLYEQSVLKEAKLLAIQPDFPVGTSLGLLVHESAASFRNAHIQWLHPSPSSSNQGEP